MRCLSLLRAAGVNDPGCLAFTAEFTRSCWDAHPLRRAAKNAQLFAKHAETISSAAFSVIL
jgi:hypothetical protein